MYLGAGMDDAERFARKVQTFPTWHLLRSVLALNLNKNPASRFLEVDIATSGDLVYCIQFS